MKKQAFFRSVLAQFICVFLVSCGGGTSGTGLNEYEGRVTDISGAPVNGAVMTVQSTGDSATTDANGEFLITSEASGEEVSILAEAEGFSGHVKVRNVFPEHSRIRINMTIDRVKQEASKVDFNVKAQFVGFCDYYFENRSTIRQANAVPGGTICTVKVDLLADGQRLDGASVALEYASCEQNAIWRPVVAGITGAENPGEVKLSFEFISSSKFCRYRVVAPYKLGNAWPVYYPIDTFAEQASSRVVTGAK